jgi:hypothetical protein
MIDCNDILIMMSSSQLSIQSSVPAIVSLPIQSTTQTIAQSTAQMSVQSIDQLPTSMKESYKDDSIVVEWSSISNDHLFLSLDGKNDKNGRNGKNGKNDNEYTLISGILFNSSINRKGWRMTSSAMESIVEDFNKTRDVPYLHNFFINHDFMNVESMVGRVTDLKYDKDRQEVVYQAKLNRCHPVVERLEMFKSVSASILVDDFRCGISNCGKKYNQSFFGWSNTCDHPYDGKNNFPEAYHAKHIETSIVTMPAYDTSLEMNSSPYSSVVSLSSNKMIAGLMQAHSGLALSLDVTNDNAANVNTANANTANKNLGNEVKSSKLDIEILNSLKILIDQIESIEHILVSISK